MICAPIAEPTVADARGAMVRATTRADLVELRLDHLDAAPTRDDLAALLRDRPCPVIVTNRPASEGGKHDRPDDARLRALEQAMELGADYVDVELERAGRLARRGSSRVIVSYHNFGLTPLNLRETVSRIAEAGADVIKIATMANSLIDNFRVLDVVRDAALPCIGLCMGELGLLSRVLGRKVGALLTYGPMDPARGTAPGQIPVDTLIGLYHYRSIDSGTAVYGVIGNPVGHSISPHIHNAAFRSLGINAVYVPFKVEGDVRTFIEAARGVPVQGYSITIPHKEAALLALDEVASTCRQIGAVNTVVNRNGRLVGSNTDWTAALEAIESRLPDGLGGRRVALVGAGGTARAIAFGLRAKGAATRIYNRTHKRAAELAAAVGCEWAPLDALASLAADVVVNATSVGMTPDVDASPVPASALRSGMVVFDAVYNPARTRLLAEAERKGCIAVSGIEMFVNQAVQQFQTWTGREAPRELMDAVVRERLAAVQ